MLTSGNRTGLQGLHDKYKVCRARPSARIHGVYRVYPTGQGRCDPRLPMQPGIFIALHWIRLVTVIS